MGLLDGKTAVIIGGHSGFGEAISTLFAKEGAFVAVAARRQEMCEDFAKSIGGAGFKVDITQDESLAKLVEDVTALRGGIHIGVNCAGFTESLPIAEATGEKLRAMTDVMFVGAVLAMRYLGNAIADSGGGAFLSFSSLTAQDPSRGQVHYASSKYAVEYATQIAAIEYGSKNVRFNIVAPSLVRTPMTAPIFEHRPQAIQAMHELTPLGRSGLPEETAQAALFLCSGMSSFVTGQKLCVDGGQSLTALPTPQIYADVAARWQASNEN
jgi:NAD(P)-dependent dehydrogenase (short-subunit alcohol dehydrogenase family)